MWRELAMPEKSKHELTEKQAEVVRLRDECGLPFAEIAERTGSDQGNVHHRYTAAKRKLEKQQPSSRQEVTAQLLENFEERCNGKPTTNESLRGDIEKLISIVIFTLQNDPVSLVLTRPKDLIVMLDKLIEKWQLLRGEPTGIVRFQDIRKLDDACKMLHDEMVRRGMVPGPVIDVTPQPGGKNGSAGPNGAGS